MFPTTMTLLANLLKIHFLEYCQTNISLTGSQFHWSWVCFFFYSPYSSHPWKSHCLKNVMFCFHWWLTIHQWTEFSISNSTYVQISYVKYIPLLCRIWPDFIQKSSLFYQQSLGMIQTRVPIFLNSPYSLDDKIRATVQLITYTVPQNCLSIFRIHNSQLFYLCPCQLRGWASFFFFLEGRHLSKIRLGANVTRKIYLYLSFVWCRVLFLSSSSISSSCCCGN